jgi:hypothetical protein
MDNLWFTLFLKTAVATGKETREIGAYFTCPEELITPLSEGL